jgi:hypothetical protein
VLLAVGSALITRRKKGASRLLRVESQLQP